MSAPARMSAIDFIYFDAGGGHRSAANALRAVVERQGRPWRVRLVNLQEVCESLDLFRHLTGVRMEDLYNKMLKRGWTLGADPMVTVMQWLIRAHHPAQVRLLARYWREPRPDLVVSLVPNFNRALLQGLRRAHPSVPYATILTDFADYPPHFWIERQPQYFVCGTPRAAEQASTHGHPASRILSVSGMILRPEFYEPLERSVPGERERLGLRPDVPTGLVLFGGQGSRRMVEIVRALQDSRHALQLILLCGRNERLAARLRALPGRVPLHVVGFTDEVPRYMRMADFFIGKPGPGSISEAVAMGLPVVVERNAWTLPQERYNTDWVREQEVGIVLRSFGRIQEAVDTLLTGDTLARLRARTRCVQNRAVFEIPDLLEQMLAGGALTGARQARSGSSGQA